MSIEPTGRRIGGAPARPRDESPPFSATGTPGAGPSITSVTRQVDERLSLRADPGGSSRSQSVADRPRAALPSGQRAGARASEPQPGREATGLRLQRLRASLTRYYEVDSRRDAPLDRHEVQAVAQRAFDDADELMHLLEGMKGQQRAQAYAEGLPVLAYQMRVYAAYQLACNPPRDEDLVLAIAEARAQGLPNHEMGALLDEGIAHADRKNAEAQRYLPVLRAAIEKFGTVKGLAEWGAPECLQRAVTGLAEALHGQLAATEMRMMFVMLRMDRMSEASHEFSLAVAPFGQLTAERLDQLSMICDLHEDARVPLRPEEKQWLAAHIDALRGDAEAACLEGCRLAANALDGRPSTVADTLLQFADSFRMMVASLEELRDLPRLPSEVAARIPGFTCDGVPTERPDVLAEQREAAAQASADALARKDAGKPAQAVRASTSSSRAKKGHRKQAPSRATAAPAAPAETPVVHELAHERLRQFPPPVAAAAGALDLVGLGARLKRDTSVLRMFTDRTDPLVVGAEMRRLVRSWFGEPASWQRMRRQVDGEASNPAARVALLAEIDQRLAGIDKLMEQIDTQELDQVKTHARPQEAHIELLRTAGQLASVSPLRLLPSGTDPDPAHGTVFEAAIQPVETSTGERPVPIYLHLHTNAPTTLEGCRKLPLGQLAAAHFKSDAQRGHGAKWEQLYGAIGQIHRGRLETPALLRDLQRRMA